MHDYESLCWFFSHARIVDCYVESEKMSVELHTHQSLGLPCGDNHIWSLMLATDASFLPILIAPHSTFKGSYQHSERYPPTSYPRSFCPSGFHNCFLSPCLFPLLSVTLPSRPRFHVRLLKGYSHTLGIDSSAEDHLPREWGPMIKLCVHLFDDRFVITGQSVVLRIAR